MKKPTKSLNLVGFVTICISTGGERGKLIFHNFKLYLLCFQLLANILFHCFIYFCVNIVILKSLENISNFNTFRGIKYIVFYSINPVCIYIKLFANGFDL